MDIKYIVTDHTFEGLFGEYTVTARICTLRVVTTFNAFVRAVFQCVIIITLVGLGLSHIFTKPKTTEVDRLAYSRIGVPIFPHAYV